jgi:hypothetical protein
MACHVVKRMGGRDMTVFALQEGAFCAFAGHAACLEKQMSNSAEKKPVERLFPFVLRSRILMIGGESLMRQRGKLHFILITRDLSEKMRQSLLRQFAPYPIIQHYTSAELEQFFGVKGAKVLGFRKSGLAQSIYAELKEYRINQAAHPNPGARAN